MDYLHYRFKNWKPGDFLGLKAGHKKIARIYMQEELKERQKRIDEIQGAFGGSG